MCGHIFRAAVDQLVALWTIASLLLTVNQIVRDDMHEIVDLHVFSR